MTPYPKVESLGVLCKFFHHKSCAVVQAYPHSAGPASQRLQARRFTAKGGGSFFF